MYRAFRKAYKWPAHAVDTLTINRILRIYDELIEDAPKHDLEDELD